MSTTIEKPMRPTFNNCSDKVRRHISNWFSDECYSDYFGNYKNWEPTEDELSELKVYKDKFDEYERDPYFSKENLAAVHRNEQIERLRQMPAFAAGDYVQGITYEQYLYGQAMQGLCTSVFRDQQQHPTAKEIAWKAKEIVEEIINIQCQ